PPPLTSSPYPYAAAPDIIRAHQKDAYFQGVLANQLSDLHRRLRGARSAHAWAAETRTFAAALYLCLTTLLGNRTLGEEYCDLVQVEEAPSKLFASSSSSSSSSSKAADDHIYENSLGDGGPLLPSLPRRAGYILTAIVLPHLASRALPSVRSAIRKRLQSRLATLSRRRQQQQQQQQQQQTGTKSGSGRGGGGGITEYRVLRYLLAHLTPLTSGAHFRAATLAVFYFTGAYYELSKWVWGLRYVFTTRAGRVDDDNHHHYHSPQHGGGNGGRAGYEVLGVLLVVQMAVRAWLHVREQLSSGSSAAGGGGGGGEEEEDGEDGFRERTAFGPGANVDVSLDEHAFTSNNELLGGGGGGGSSSQRSWGEIGAMAHTPVLKAGRARYDLGTSDKVMGWIKGAQQRKCTLCLEELKDPAATQCGHVFCWACIGDWVREKPECPLCRREAMVQHILPLRVA
ncbi:Pex12 amino terminal region-domain-containing protein, partial [Thermothelomyces heterothallicus CBS 202.75]|uniref:Pex12 amino terminal region-domain-containing protein n=1 Tax=Thermothelomyces heterothallicus CBS 202.75 TaxID=1149848 RepID=UPI0037438E97